MTIDQRIKELLELGESELPMAPETEALLLSAILCTEGHPLPSGAFLCELTEVIKDRRANDKIQP